MSLLQLFLSLLFFSDLLLLSSAKSIITLSLSRATPSQTTNPSERLKYHAAASLARANQLKHTNAVVDDVPLYPRSYGAYSINLGFGTPRQTLRFTMDTGGNTVWFPCTHHYICNRCDFPGVDPAHIPTFIPESSSSYKNITCQSQYCKWPSPDLQCKNQSNCEYLYTYGSGDTTGRLISDTLTIPGLSVDDFIVGCSVSTDAMAEGIAGFGRDEVSLPSQLNLTSFAYCLISHDFNDDTTASSDLILISGGGGGNGPTANYTPFVPNSAYLDHYYVSLQSISVGGVNVDVPDEFLVPDANGSGGTVVDSGGTLTLLEQSMFDSVFKELDKQVGQIYEREKKIENETGLELCYNVKNNDTSLPQLTFHFQGNTEMVPPVTNYFVYVDNSSVACLTIGNLGEVEGGPAVILGNDLQQDFYMEFDLENNQLGIRQQKCKL